MWYSICHRRHASLAFLDIGVLYKINMLSREYYAFSIIYIFFYYIFFIFYSYIFLLYFYISYLHVHLDILVLVAGIPFNFFAKIDMSIESM